MGQNLTRSIIFQEIPKLKMLTWDVSFVLQWTNNMRNAADLELQKELRRDLISYKMSNLCVWLIKRNKIHLQLASRSRHVQTRGMLLCIQMCKVLAQSPSSTLIIVIIQLHISLNSPWHSERYFTKGPSKLIHLRQIAGKSGDRGLLPRFFLLLETFKHASWNIHLHFSWGGSVQCIFRECFPAHMKRCIQSIQWGLSEYFRAQS